VENAVYTLLNEVLTALNNKARVKGLFCDIEKAFVCIVLYCIYFGSRNPEDIEQVNVQQYKPQTN
jgi:hypothetical protein